MGKVVVSVGGSLIAPKGIDSSFLKKFRSIVLDFAARKNSIVLVCGGGNLNREYNAAALAIARVSDNNLDWLGIAATKLNAELVRVILGDAAHAEVMTDPSRKIKTRKRIIVASGWKPGWSSDYDAVLLAMQTGAKRVVNLSNISFVYDKDPKKHKDAKKFSSITWRQYLGIVGKEWKPRMSVPFDPIASQLAMKNGISVQIVRGTDLGNVKKALYGKKASGTVIY